MKNEPISTSNINAILRPGDTERQERQEKKIRRQFWPTMKRAIAQLPISEDIATAYFCALDPKTPTRVRGTLLAALAYFILPVDLIPDFIAAIGFGDDLAVFTVAFSTLKNHMTDAQRETAKKALNEMATQNSDEMQD